MSEHVCMNGGKILEELGLVKTIRIKKKLYYVEAKK